MRMRDRRGSEKTEIFGVRKCNPAQRQSSAWCRETKTLADCSVQGASTAAVGILTWGAHIPFRSCNLCGFLPRKMHICARCFVYRSRGLKDPETHPWALGQDQEHL